MLLELSATAGVVRCWGRPPLRALRRCGGLPLPSAVGAVFHWGRCARGACKTQACSRLGRQSVLCSLLAFAILHPSVQRPPLDCIATWVCQYLNNVAFRVAVRLAVQVAAVWGSTRCCSSFWAVQTTNRVSLHTTATKQQCLGCLVGKT